MLEGVQQLSPRTDTMAASGAGDAPAAAAAPQRSRCRVTPRASEWGAHEFQVWSGGGEQLVCRVAVLRMSGSILLWVGGARPALGEAALATVSPEGPGSGCTTLLTGDGSAPALARRLAAALHKPVFVFCGTTFDRFTLPLVERGLVAEIKSRPECF